MTVWWLSQDTRMPDWDSAAHATESFHVYARIARGHLVKVFTEFNAYPPLGRSIGALGVLVAGRSNHAVIFATNLVFVPVLAASCYGVGKLVGTPRAGLLAAVFALATPMIVSEAHEAYLDPLQAALVALSVLAILAARRFERVGVAALAGAATACAMLVKQTTPIFLVGLLAVVLVRGGWRNWRGLCAYLLVLIALGAPWYLEHSSELGQLVLAHTANANTVETNPGGGVYPALLSFKNLTWYFWNAGNIQLQAGFLLFLLVGLVFAARSAWVERTPSNLYPELLGGLFVSWLGMTLIKHKDPRYDLPALVYVAVLSTSWIAGFRAVARRWVTAGLFGVAA
ncbi:MAG TPA: glycosyltransferase family 39 protein, partial [Solirubrobacteraceae bacterium]|nr:glycosyltransferase family 39 protein [Solirubrobacteraceae bacterium]